MIPDLLSMEGKGGVTKSAGEFSLPEIVETFGLKYSTIAFDDNIESYIWNVEDSNLNFTMTLCLGKLSIPTFKNVIYK